MATIAWVMSEQSPTLEELRKAIKEEVRPVWKMLEKHERTIYGNNGDPGLRTRLATMEKDVQANTKLRHHVYGIWGTIGAGGLVGAIAAARDWLKSLVP